MSDYYLDYFVFFTGISTLLYSRGVSGVALLPGDLPIMAAYVTALHMWEAPPPPAPAPPTQAAIMVPYRTVDTT